MTVFRVAETDFKHWLKGAVTRLTAPANLTAGVVNYVMMDLQRRAHIHHEQLFAGENLVQHYLETHEKPVSTQQNSYDRSTSAAAEVVRTAKASAGRIYEAWGTNANAGTRFMQLHNTAGAPAGGAIPIISISVATTLQTKLDIPICGIWLDTGITVCFSTTQNTYTAAGNDHIITVLYK